MKKLIITVSALLLSANVLASDKSYVTGDDSSVSKLCLAAASGSTIKLRSLVKKVSTSNTLAGKYMYISNNITCNGQPIAEFARDAGNFKVAKLLDKHQTSATLDLAKVDSKQSDKTPL